MPLSLGLGLGIGMKGNASGGAGLVTVFADDFSTYADSAALNVAWTAGGTTPIVTLLASPSRIHVENGAASTVFAGRSFTTVNGRTYYVSGTCVAITTGFLRIQVGSSGLNGNDLNPFSVNATGPFSYTFVALSTTTWITINTNTTTINQGGDIDDLLVKT